MIILKKLQAKNSLSRALWPTVVAQNPKLFLLSLWFLQNGNDGPNGFLEGSLIQQSDFE